MSQAVDKTKGIHALIAKKDFSEFTNIKLKTNGAVIDSVIKPDGLYAPAAKVFNAIGAQYSFDSETKSLTVNYNNNTYVFNLASNKYSSNDEIKTLTKSPYIEDNTYYIPTSALLDVMKIPLNWSTDGNNIYGTLGY